MSKIWFFIRPWLGLMFSRSGAILKNAAIDIVSQIDAAYGDLSGPEKAEMARQSIKARLKGAGVELSTAAVNAAIEMAVLRLQAK